MLSKDDVLRGVARLLPDTSGAERSFARLRHAIRRCAADYAREDLVLGGVGCALASVSLIFAFEMIRAPREPYIPGIEYLAIFAQPNNSAAIRAAQRAAGSAPGSPGLTPGSPGVDYDPTAAIPAVRRSAARDDQTGFEILGAAADIAWVRLGSEIIEVRKGDTLPGFGKIASIEQKAGRWRFQLDAGAKESSATPARRPSPPPKLFAKPLIFDEQARVRR